MMRQNASQPLCLSGAMLPQCFVGRFFEAPNLNIALNVAVPHPGAQFCHFFFGEICDGAFDFLHGAHGET
jgi:hypothetical protein